MAAEGTAAGAGQPLRRIFSMHGATMAAEETADVRRASSSMSLAASTTHVVRRRLREWLRGRRQAAYGQRGPHVSLQQMSRRDPFRGKFGFGQYRIEFAPRVLGRVERSNPVRKFCIEMVKSFWFEAVVLIMIIINCLIMALWDPVADTFGIESPINRFVTNSEWFFQPLFTIEAMIKIMALGLFVVPSGYFTDSWNILDFCIVTIGWIPLFLGADSSPNSSMIVILRFTRVLRPLRAIRRFPSLQLLVESILNAGREISNVLLLCASILMIFAIMGVTLFNGKLRQRCGIWDNVTDTWAIPVDDLDSFCSMYPGSYGRRCPTGLECIVTDFNPRAGLQSFDNIYLALLTVFQIITLEGWSDVMFGLFDTTYKIFGIYFVLLTFFGAYFMVNLLVAALSVNYMLVRERSEANRKREDRALAGGSGRRIRQNIAVLVEKAEKREAKARKFAQLDLDRQIAVIQMRLMYSYDYRKEKGLEDGPVSEKMYNEYRALHGDNYSKEWKAHFRKAEQKRKHAKKKTVQHAKKIDAENSAAREAEASFEDEGYMESHRSLRDIYEYSSSEPDGSIHSALGDLEIEAEDEHTLPEAFLESHSSLNDVHGSDETPRERQGSVQSDGFTYHDAFVVHIPQQEDQHQVQKNISLRVEEDDAGLEEEDDDDDSSLTSESTYGAECRTCHEHSKRLKKEYVAIGSKVDAPKWRKFIYVKITSTSWFEGYVRMLIVVNTAVLASVHFDQQEWAFVLDNVSNAVFLSLFTLEIILRVCGEGIYKFVSEPFNRFDCFVVLTGYIELVSPLPSLSALRVLRILRLVRFYGKTYPSFKELVGSLERTLKQVIPFLFFLAIIMYIFTVSGLHLLGGRLVMQQIVEVPDFVFPEGVNLSSASTTLVQNKDFDCTAEAGQFLLRYDNGTEFWHCPPRTNYDTFLWSFVTTFQVITGEDWNGVMTEVVEQTNTYGLVIYFLFAVLFGSFIVLNFFLAILLDTFISHHMKTKETNEGQRSRLENAIHDALHGSEEDGSASVSASGTVSENCRASAKSSANTVRPMEMPQEQPRSPRPRLRRMSSTVSNLQEHLDRRKKKRQNLDLDDVRLLPAFRGPVLCGMISEHSKLRLNVAVLVHRSWFDNFVLLVIAWSCFMLAVDGPVDPLFSEEAIFGMNIAITIVFGIEVLLKVFALGLIQNKGAYLRDWWNCLDFFIFIVSLIDVCLPRHTSAEAIKILRTTRALRPLRAVRKFEGLRIIVQSFAMAIVPCVQVVLLCIMVYGLFAISSVSLFSGRFFACYECPLGNDGGSLFDQPDQVCHRNYSISSPNCVPYPEHGITELDCPLERRCEGIDKDLGVEYRWLLPTYGSLSETSGAAKPYSFNNIISSWLTLFETSSKEIWMEPMYMSSDVTSVGFNPIRGSSDYYSLYFVLFLFTMQCFMLQIFVAVLINTYLDSADQETGLAFMSQEQREWVDLQRRAFLRQAEGPDALIHHEGCLRALCLKISVHQYFERFIIAVISLNTVWFLTEHFDPDSSWEHIFFIVESVFGSIYVVEAIIKIVGLGLFRYFRYKSNCFDFLIVLAVILNWSLLGVLKGGQSNLLLAIESLRVFRIFRLFKHVARLRALFSTLMLTAFPIINITGLILIVFFVFSVLGMELFGGKIDFEDSRSQFLSPRMNFDNFGNSFYTLFVVSTGEDWNGFLRELHIVSVHATWYICLFVVLTQIIMMNLFVAVILTNYTAEFARSQRPDGVKQNLDENSFQNYDHVWNKLAEEHTKQLVANLKELKQAHSKQHSTIAPEAIEIMRAARRELRDARSNSDLLPAEMFAKLVLDLKAPLGLKKRKKVRKKDDEINFTTTDVMYLVKGHRVPVFDGKIHRRETLRALIDINMLNEEMADDVKAFLNYRLGLDDKVDEGSQLCLQMRASSLDEGAESVEQVIAKEQIEAMIRRYVMHYRLRKLHERGASKEEIRELVSRFAAGAFLERKSLRPPFSADPSSSTQSTNWLAQV